MRARNPLSLLVWILLFLFFVAPITCAQNLSFTEAKSKLFLHADWKFRQVGTTRWYPATPLVSDPESDRSEGVGECCAKNFANSFRVLLLIENLLPGLKRSWASISERLRRNIASSRYFRKKSERPDHKPNFGMEV